MESEVTNKKVLIIGAGFAGLFAARRLAKRKDLEIQLLERGYFFFRIYM